VLSDARNAGLVTCKAATGAGAWDSLRAAPGRSVSLPPRWPAWVSPGRGWCAPG